MFEGPFPLASLDEVAVPIQRPVVPQAGMVLRQIGVRLWGGGAYERERLDGAATRYGVLFGVEANDIIVNKIWARNGSVGIVPAELTGCVASGEFPIYRPDVARLEPRWFHWLTKTKAFWLACDEKSRGTSGKNRIRPEQFLSIRIPLPPLSEQRRIVGRIEQVAGKVEEARRLRAECTSMNGVLEPAVLSAAYDQSHSLAGCTERLDSLCRTITDGTHTTPSYIENGVPFLSVKDISSGAIRFDKKLSENAVAREPLPLWAWLEGCTRAI